MVLLLFRKWHAGQSCQGNGLFYQARRDYGTATRRFRAEFDNCLTGRFCLAERLLSLLVAKFVTLWLPKTLEVHAGGQRSGVNNTGINISMLLFLPDN